MNLEIVGAYSLVNNAGEVQTNTASASFVRSRFWKVLKRYGRPNSLIVMLVVVYIFNCAEM